MYKRAEEVADDVLARQAINRKRQERWVGALTGGALTTGLGLATKRLKPRHLPGEALGNAFTGWLSAEAPKHIWKDPKEFADHPRWWRDDYDPTTYGAALGVGSGLGMTGGYQALKALTDRGHFQGRGMKDLATLGILIPTSLAGYMAARKLMELRAKD